MTRKLTAALALTLALASLAAFASRGNGGAVRGAAARAGMMARNAVPYDAEVEYLAVPTASSNYKYIDTEIEIKRGTGFDIYIYAPSAANISALAGDYNKAEKLVVCNNWMFLNDYSWGVYNFGSEKSGNIRYVMIKDSSYCSHSMLVNGQMIESASEIPLRSVSDSGVNVFLFFGINNAFPQQNAMRMYYCKLYEYSEIVRDLIPVRVGSVGYMYDRISGRLFGNSGTGAFIVGPDK